ncbi:RNA polymerase-binding protein DksA [Psychrobacter pacificensis]|uniref:RNA polymerase-binding protein DksA n=1 Tax=Psychrobacter pacificensis TaxID=112002 RepID=UPI003D034893
MSTVTTNPSEFKFTPYVPAPDEEYMSDAQLEHFKAILLEWKNQLIGEADRTKSYIQDESSAMPDINDRATQEEEFALALRTRDRERKLIRKIDKSILEIENDDYGFCETCGVEIGLRRLEARPTATQCIDCKTLSEIKERQNQGA